METMQDNPFAGYEDKADVSIPSATLQIYQYIAETLNRPKKDTSVNRASSATYCVKRRWYQRQGIEGTPLTPRKIINFMLGDLTEMVMLYWIKEGCVGPGKLYSEVKFGDVQSSFEINRGGDPKKVEIYSQKTLTTMIGDMKITCHADGFGKRNFDGKWELIEVKSSANWGFDEFKAEGAGDYLKQAHTVMASEECRLMGIEAVRYFYMRKETGHPWDRVHFWNEATWVSVKQEFIDAMKDEEMPPPYQLVQEMEGRKPNKKPTGRLTAQFPCTYCSYLEKCQGKYTLEWKEGQHGVQTPKYIFTKETDPFKKVF